MKTSKRRLLGAWLHARRMTLAYVAVIFACFFVVYGVYGYPFGVAGYAALLCLAAGAVFAVYDFSRFAAKHIALSSMAGRFPLAPLPQPDTLAEKDYTEIIAALEAERIRLERANQTARWDAEEYYTLWAHQIKTPLAAMHLLLQSTPNTPSNNTKAEIEQELFRINQYVGMVLQYQRLSSLQNDLALHPHSLQAMVKKSAKACAPLFIHKKLGLDADNIQGEIITDEKWFCFVLEQLLTNAAKYTRQGYVRVYTPNENTLVVEDSGIGIAPQDQPRVFERGFTGTVGRQERSSTGIGLFLCHKILHRLGFGISIQSAPGKGTKVLLHLAQNRLQQE